MQSALLERKGCCVDVVPLISTRHQQELMAASSAQPEQPQRVAEAAHLTVHAVSRSNMLEVGQTRV